MVHIFYKKCHKIKKKIKGSGGEIVLYIIEDMIYGKLSLNKIAMEKFLNHKTMSLKYEYTTLMLN